ncbi:MAG: WD40 repeat protein [Crocinitomix sp.]|jgi:WD40 repeat protein
MKNALFVYILLLLFGHSHAQSPKVVVQDGHNNWVNAIAFDHGGSFIASAGRDNMIKIWDLNSGKLMQTLGVFKKSNSRFKSLCFNSNNQYVAATSSDKSLKIWNIKSGSLIKDFSQAKTAYSHVTFHPNNKAFLATWKNDTSKIKLILYQGKTFTDSLVFESEYNLLKMPKFSNSGSYVAATAYNKLVVWNCESGEVIWELEDDFSGGSDFQFSGDSLVFVLNSAGDLNQFDLRLGTLSKTSNHEKLNNSRKICLAADLSTVFYLNQNNELLLYNLNNRADEHAYGGHIESINMLAYNDYSNLMASCSDDQTIKIWDKNSNEMLFHFKSSVLRYTNVSIDPTNRYVVLIPGHNATMGARFFNEIMAEDKNLRIFDLTSGRLIGVINVNEEIRSVTFLKSGNAILTGNIKGELEFWDLTLLLTGEKDSREIESIIISQKPGYLEEVCLTADNTSLLLRYSNGLVESYDFNGTELSNNTSFGFGKSTITLSADGKNAALGNNQGGIHIVDRESGDISQRLAGHSSTVSSLDFNSDKTFLLSGSFDGRVILWDLLNDRQKTLGTHDYFISTVQFSPDGQIAVSGGWDHKLKVFNTQNESLIKELNGHDFAVNDLTFSPDGNFLISVGSDGKSILWDTDKWEELLVFTTTPFTSDYAIFDRAGNYMATQQGLRSVGFEKGGMAYDFHQFDLYYNRPAKVVEQLTNANTALSNRLKTARDKRFKQLRIAPLDGIDLERIPDLNITNNTELRKDLGYSTSQNDVKIKITAKGKDAPIEQVNVWVNGVPDLKNSFRISPQMTFDTVLTVSLSNGQNSIEISVKDTSNTPSIGELFSIRSNSESSQNLYVVSIGISNYLTMNNLTYSANEANDLGNAIQQIALNKGNSNFTEIRTMGLSDSQVNKLSLDSVYLFLENAKVNDVVLIYLAGHGEIESFSGEYYFPLSNSTSDNLLETGIAYQEIDSLLGKLNVRNKLLILNTCFSGLRDEEADGFDYEASEEFLLMRDLFVDTRRTNGATIISSAGGYDYFTETSRSNRYSIVVDELIILLSENTELTVFELAHQLNNKVKSYSSFIENAPEIRYSNSKNNFRIW